MTLTDRTIAALRRNHDHLATVVGGLTDEQLTGPSGASEWTVADVLSHLGSGSEINRYLLERAVRGDTEVPENQVVWDRWNALPASGRASGSLESVDRLVALLEGLTAEQRAGTMVDLGFTPQPLPLATVLGMRINEQALHVWDAEVGADPAAGLSDEAAGLVLEHLASTARSRRGYDSSPAGSRPSTPPQAWR